MPGINGDCNLAVIGGGAAGFMTALRAAESGLNNIAIFESTKSHLQKVRISGGGRCNITNACFENSDLVNNYPRGKLSLKGAFSRFSTKDAVSWFEKRGLQLKIENDGRIFPRSNTSKDVINCLIKNAEEHNISFTTKMELVDVKNLVSENLFQLEFKNGLILKTKKLLLATGSGKIGKKIAQKLGHRLIQDAPSLFSFKVSDTNLSKLSGITVEGIKVKLITKSKKFVEQGPILITHRGVSGPVILKLSAFAARELYSLNYSGIIKINWINKSFDTIRSLLFDFRDKHSSLFIHKYYPFKNISKRLWAFFLEKNKIFINQRWCGLSNKEINRLARLLEDNTYQIIGRGPFGEEFVTAGGVSLKQINFSTMESRLCKGLYFAGEILDIDGITGGFNFQHCWTSGWIAGEAVARAILFSS